MSLETQQRLASLAAECNRCQTELQQSTSMIHKASALEHQVLSLEDENEQLKKEAIALSQELKALKEEDQRCIGRWVQCDHKTYKAFEQWQREVKDFRSDVWRKLANTPAEKRHDARWCRACGDKTYLNGTRLSY